MFADCRAVPEAWVEPCDVSYKLKAKYGGLDLSDTKRLRHLEEENAKLKRLAAAVMLDNVVLQDLLGKP